jgi:hypothetical protein
MLAKQVLYHSGHAFNLFNMVILEITTFCAGQQEP